MKQSHPRTLAQVSGDVRPRGSWPGTVQLRRGWALARARPWNDQTERSAAVRLERGSDRFLAACARWLTRQGVSEVLSSALAESQTGVWRRGGFDDHLRLDVYERSLLDAVGEPHQPVVEMDDPDLPSLAAIDDLAFEPRWRVGRLGLAEAISATPHSVVLSVNDGGRLAGFSIVGETVGVAYLQRLAVDPVLTGRGIGRSIVRESIRWARQSGARSMLLNTQPENAAAAALYDSEGFFPVGSPLAVLRWTGSMKGRP